MDRKLMCISNVKYKQPTAEGGSNTENLLKYLTYRESRDQKAIQAAGRDRWMDHGMGKSVATIIDRCQAYQSKHVLMFSIVLNPNPDLIQMVPPEKREQFVQQLTEGTMTDFFSARGIDTGVEWSAVMHHRDITSGQTIGQHDPHTHIVVPGTYYDADEGQRKPLYFSRNKEVNHIELLHNVTQQNMEALLERHVGRDWEQRIDHLTDLREQQARVVESDEPHGWHLDIGPVWGGVRQSDEHTCHVGYYYFNDNHAGKKALQFQPAYEEDFDVQTAEIHANQLKRQLEAQRLEMQEKEREQYEQSQQMWREHYERQEQTWREQQAQREQNRQTPDVQETSFDIDF